MRYAITGAGGFVGRALAARMADLGLSGDTLLIDREDFRIDGFACETVDLAKDPGALAILDGLEVVCHLAALPGAAAEADPGLSRSINLQMPLNMIEKLEGKRLILASSIAVYGNEFGALVDDSTPAMPSSVYATHKRMTELAFVDALRREKLSGVAVRLSGIVARPPSAAGFGSAFLSDIFHAVLNSQQYVVPVSEEATSWVASSSACAKHLAHAMLGDFSASEPLLLPATHIHMKALVSALDAYGDCSGIRYEEKPVLRQVFGSYPSMKCRRSIELGFLQAETLPELLKAVTHDL